MPLWQKPVQQSEQNPELMQKDSHRGSQFVVSPMLNANLSEAPLLPVPASQPSHAPHSRTQLSCRITIHWHNAKIAASQAQLVDTRVLQFPQRPIGSSLIEKGVDAPRGNHVLWQEYRRYFMNEVKLLMEQAC